MTRHTLATLAVTALAAFAARPDAGAQTSAPATTVIVVRHAEAVANAGADPVLAEAGIARAQALAAALRDANVKAVFTTQYQRTALTGEPLATAVNAPLTKAAVAGPTDVYVKQIVDTVFGKHAGGTVVIVGHSNTVPALVKGFSGVEIGEIAHDAYDNMFVITTAGPGAGHVVRARYGAR